MSTPRKIPRPFTEDQLREFVREALSSGQFREAPHSHKDRAWRNISNEDIMHGLERVDWKFGGQPEFDPARGRWRYRIATRDVEGEELTLVVSPWIERCLLELITKF
jgi:hypothetical protein